MTASGRRKVASGRAQRGAPRGVRIEQDSMGELEVAESALWGAQTERARRNFQFSERRMPRAFLRALGLLKAAAARANAELGLLPQPVARAIERAALAVAEGNYDAHFPVDVFQTGSGTSTNMNANEVIARLASSSSKRAIHPNDHVNFGQSSNDVIPSALLVAAHLVTSEELLPALVHLRQVIQRRVRELGRVVKTGRTHLMDAVPLTFGQELSAWASQVQDVETRLGEGAKRLRRLPLGGTAVGTGLNADPRLAKRALALLSKQTGLRFEQAPNLFAGLASPDAAGELAGTLQGLASVLLKISNDLRLMNSGPLAGFGDIQLPTLQPGSSIMPGKVNPVIPEAVAMASVQILGATEAIRIACASGSFQLNVMLPLIADQLLTSLALAARAARSLADQAILGFTVREAHVLGQLAKNPILVTALNPILGYERGAAIAKKAYAEGRPILEVAREETDLPEAELRRLLDPWTLTQGGMQNMSGKKSGATLKKPAKRAGPRRGSARSWGRP